MQLFSGDNISTLILMLASLFCSSSVKTEQLIAAADVRKMESVNH